MLLLPTAGRSSQNARKIGNLFASRIRGLKRQCARDRAEVLAARDGPKKGRALDDGEIERLAVSRTGDEAEARITDIAEILRQM